MKKYNILYLDPPWAYNARNNDNTKFGGGITNKYPSMSMDQIKDLPIPELSAENCALFMWCTFPYLDDQIKLFKHWGFDYKTIGFNWIKTNPRNNKPFFGVGYYTKSNPELCLLGIKGRMKPIDNTISSVIISPRREHSRKPDEVREKIIQLFGDLPRLEMFARQKTEGWDVWGNQVISDIDLAS